MACKAWEAICRVRIGAERVKEANADCLRLEFAELNFKSDEGVEDFGLRIIGLANQLCVLDDDITDKEVVKKGSSSGGGNSGGHGDHGYGRGRGRGHSGGCNGGARSS
jgi:hypothetical protein